MKTDFEALFGNIDVEVIKLCKRITKEQQEEGVEDKQILYDTLSFIIDQLHIKEMDEVNHYNNMVAEGIKGLSRKGKWPQLNSIAEHALEEAEKAADKHNLMKNYMWTFKIKNEVLNTGSDYFKDIFKEEFLDKFKENKK